MTLELMCFFKIKTYQHVLENITKVSSSERVSDGVHVIVCADSTSLWYGIGRGKQCIRGSSKKECGA